MSQKPVEADRSERRRQQILDAAQDCFRKNGFHATSMAELSKTAGMSVGHIYHYFENKDAIIAGIFERGIAEATERMDAMRRSGDVYATLVAEVDQGLCKTERDYALKIESLAEAARNDKMLAMLQNADRVVRTQFKETLRLAQRPGTIDERDLDGQVEIIVAMFNGLAHRLLLQPELDRDALVRVMRRAVAAVIRDPNAD